MSKAFESGKAFLATVLAKLPEGLRAEAEKTLTAPEAAEALIALGDGVLARSDYSRLADDIREKDRQIAADYEQLNTWFATNKDRLGSVETLEQEIARLKGEPVPPKEVPVAKPGMSADDLEAILAKRDEGYAGVLAFTTTLATRHLQQFQEVLDVQDLVTTATKQRVSLQAAYDAKYGEKVAAKAADAEKARIEQLVTARLAEERSKHVDQPYPLRNASPSVLDVLDSKEDSPSKHTVDSAMAEYERLQATR